MTSSPLRQRMIQDLRIRGRSENTLRAYVRQIKQFARHFGMSPEQLGLAEVRAYQVYLIEHKRASRAELSQFVAAARFLYESTLERDWKMKSIAYPKMPVRLPKIISEREVKQLLEAVSNRKHRSILMTLYSAGLRVSEACCLRVSHIDGNRMLMCVEQGKGSKDRYVPLSRSLLIALREYWKQYRPQDYLFPGRHGRPITSRHVYRVCVDAGKAAGIRQTVHPHLLRHSFATHLLDRGANILQIQTILGHHSLRTTSRYIHLSQQNLQAIPNPLDLLIDGPDTEGTA